MSAELLKEMGFEPDWIKVMFRALFTYKQAALYLACSPEEISTLVEGGEISIILRGTRKLIPRAECDAWIELNKRKKAG